MNIVSKHEIQKTEELLHLKQDLWKCAKVRGRQLEEKKKDLHNKLVGTKYNMDEHKKLAEEGQQAVEKAKAPLWALEGQQSLLLQHVRILDFTPC